MDISDEEIAIMMNKPLSALLNIKEEKPDEYHILKLGAFCKKLNLDSNDLSAMFTLKSIELSPIKS